MLFYLRNRNKTIKELRKNAGFTANELAVKLKCDTQVILRIDDLKLRNISDKMKDKLIPIFRGDRYHNVPW